ncbi:unnamed protein product [Diatraea saccharalis]|uniref:Ig-like domain-containing protein n=1 Tax=Diatraea saccharalis TaxID=40085 RepID=A0A9N9WAW6_9NEOP|nr:unnamed protein product [Diatraea saccharalis]
MLSAVALLYLTHITVTTLAFKITGFHVPSVVTPDQPTADIECSYDANFTILNWFKGPTEFFRYKPGSAPSTRSFPVPGVGTIDLIACGPTECRLRLGHLTEEASGLYRCDLELDKPPYKFETRTAYMKVYRPQRRKPIVEGLATEFGENEEMKAYCRAEPDAEIRWYVNGKEITDLRGSRSFKMISKEILFKGLSQPTIVVQCAEYIDGKLIGSTETPAKWIKFSKLVNQSSVESCASENKTNAVRNYCNFLFMVLFTSFILK